MPPIRATLDEKELARLNSIYAEAIKRINQTIDGATDFGVARRVELLANIDSILAQTGQETGQWLDDVMPGAYQRGTVDALADLNRIKVGIKEASTFSVIDREAVKALISETQEAFAVSLTTVSRTASQVLSQAVKDQITVEMAAGRALGQTRVETASAIKSVLKSKGITGLVDKGGTPWSLDSYANMLARTKMVEARNTGVVNKMVQNGYDLVEVSLHFSDHQACAQYEGKILSITGNTPGYTTLAHAKENGLFHPNCRHQINAVKSSVAAITKAYDPTSKTYVKGFKTNPAKPPVGKIVAPKVPGGSQAVKLSGYGKSETFTLNPGEKAFAARTKLTFSAGTKQGTRNRAGLKGYYQPSKHNLHIVRPGTEGAQHTFYHELGHAIDHKVTEQVLSRTAETQKIIKAEYRAVNIQRLKHNFAEYKLSDEMASKLLAGGRAEVKHNGVMRGIQLSQKHRRYLNEYTEVFADAYGQFRTNPAKFKTYAPELFELFRGLAL